jgi:RimJ/RimL family protein N-acetyltransferase
VTDWRLGLPVLVNGRVSLREPVMADAPILFRELCAPEVCQYVAPPPAAVEGVERMIAKGLERRRAGRAFSFGIQPAAGSELAGIIQFVSTRDHVNQSSIPAVWELGFALGARHWGSGLIGDAATMALQFAFTQVSLEGLKPG